MAGGNGTFGLVDVAIAVAVAFAVAAVVRSNRVGIKCLIFRFAASFGGEESHLSPGELLAKLPQHPLVVLLVAGREPQELLDFTGQLHVAFDAPQMSLKVQLTQVGSR